MQKQARERNRRLRNLYQQTKQWICCGADYCERKRRLVRAYRGSRSKMLKIVSNRKVRRKKNAVFQHGEYRKLYDFWWELF